MREDAGADGRRRPRRVALGAGLMACAGLSWLLVPAGDPGAGYGVTRLATGVAVEAGSEESLSAFTAGVQPPAGPATTVVVAGETVVVGELPRERSANARRSRPSSVSAGRRTIGPPRSKPAPPIPAPGTAGPAGPPSELSTDRPNGENLPSAQPANTTTSSSPATSAPPGGGTTPGSDSNGTPQDQPPPETCPAPQDGAVPAVTASTQVVRPPAAGTYAYLVQPAGADRPRATADQWAVSHLDTTTWNVAVPLAPGWSTTSTLRHTQSAVELSEFRLATPAGATTVKPVRPVVDLALPAGRGTTWESSGYDLTTGVAIEVKGRYLDRQAVPLCGDIVDAWRVETTFTVTPLAVAPPGTPSFRVVATRWVATQYGALLARAAQRVEGRHGSASLDLEAVWYLREVTPR